MKRFGNLILALGLVALGSLPLAAADIDGTWIMERETQHGVQKWLVDFQSNGETLTGTIRVDGTERQWDVVDGKLDGSDFSCAIMFKRRDGSESRVSLNGTVSGQELNGKIKMPNAPEAKEFKATK
jgi:hypothetical protein